MKVPRGWVFRPYRFQSPFERDWYYSGMPGSITVDNVGRVYVRQHVTRKQAGFLAVLLKFFARRGRIPTLAEVAAMPDDEAQP